MTIDVMGTMGKLWTDVVTILTPSMTANELTQLGMGTVLAIIVGTVVVRCG